MSVVLCTKLFSKLYKLINQVKKLWKKEDWNFMLENVNVLNNKTGVNSLEECENNEHTESLLKQTMKPEHLSNCTTQPQWAWMRS